MIDVAPDPRTTPVDEVRIVFSDVVTGFDLTDLRLNGQLLTVAQTLTAIDPVTYAIGNLAPLTGAAGDYVLTVLAAGSGIQDARGSALAADASDAWRTVTNGVLARHVFYNNSAADGNDPAPTQLDDAAVDADKQALLPGAAVSPANVTGYAKGLNGIMVDIANLPAGFALATADFAVRTATAASPGAWSAGPAPSQVAIRRGAGSGGSDRVTLIWSDTTAVKNGWIEVTVRATAATGLFSPSLFAFGNLVADANGDRSVGPGDFNLLATHFGQTHQQPATGDFDGDGTVGPGDFNLLASQFGAALSPLRRSDR